MMAFISKYVRCRPVIWPAKGTTPKLTDSYPNSQGSRSWSPPCTRIYLRSYWRTRIKQALASAWDSGSPGSSSNWMLYGVCGIG